MALPRQQLETALAHLGKGDWQAAHEIVQKDEQSPLACWLHGIVHLIEGDEANARYWYRAAGRRFPDKPSAHEELAAVRTELRP